MFLFFENIGLAFSSLKANKTRAMLTMLGIIIGISSVISINAIGNSMVKYLAGSMQGAGANRITVMLIEKEEEKSYKEKIGITFGKVTTLNSQGDTYGFSEEMIEGMMREFQDDIESVSLKVDVGQTEINNGNKKAIISIAAVNGAYFAENNMKNITGNFFSNSESDKKMKLIIINDKLAKRLYGNNIEKTVGKKISINIKGYGDEFVIAGIYKDEADYEEEFYNVYVPLHTGQDMVHSRNYGSFSVVSKVGSNPELLSDSIAAYLNVYFRGKNMTVLALNMQSLLEILNEEMGLVTLAISFIAGIALVVGGIGVMNIMLVSVSERTREIGTRKALGATDGSIAMQFLTEAVVIGFMGGVIGIACGIAMGLIISKIMGCIALPSVMSVCMALVFSMVIGVSFGYYPARKAAKMNPIDALRYE